MLFSLLPSHTRFQHLISEDFDHATDLEEHKHYTCQQKSCGAMEPNTKMLNEELMKQIHEEIKYGLAAHTDLVNKHFTELEIVEQMRDDHVATLESIASAPNKLLSDWKSNVESSISTVKLELAKLNTYFNCDAKILGQY
jgi:hypothetical protein